MPAHPPPPCPWVYRGCCFCRVVGVLPSSENKQNRATDRCRHVPQQRRIDLEQVFAIAVNTQVSSTWSPRISFFSSSARLWLVSTMVSQSSRLGHPCCGIGGGTQSGDAVTQMKKSKKRKKKEGRREETRVEERTEHKKSQ